MASIDTLADALTAALNAADWGSVEFTAAHDLMPVFDRSVMGDSLAVRVVPANRATAGRLDRRRSRMALTVDIGFAVFVESAAIAAVRPWVAFVESVQTWCDEELKTLSGNQYLRSEFDPLYDARQLRDNSLFFSVLAVTWQAN